MATIVVVDPSRGRGAQGQQGTQGDEGAQGSQGDVGAQGQQGGAGADSTAEGPQGTQGQDGAQGDAGTQGTAGAQGATGADGAGAPGGNVGDGQINGGGATFAGLPVIGFGTRTWSSGITYNQGYLTLDRGGVWESAINGNINSQPISGNADWTLVGGEPWVLVDITPTVLTTAPFQDATSTGPGLVVVPDPFAQGLVAVATGFASVLSDGEDWSGAVDINFGVGSDTAAGSNGAYIASSLDGMNGVSVGLQFSPLATDMNPASPVTDGSVIIWTTDVVTGGSRSVQLKVFYKLIPAAYSGSLFYPITALVAGPKTVTVTDAGADLNGATGTFQIVGNTGAPTNDGTYTIVSAVSGAGSTVITVVEAIPDETAADGWAKFA